MKLALALLFVGVGVTLIYSGLTGEPLTPVLSDVLHGRDPKGKLSKGDSDNSAPGIAGKGTTPDVPPPQNLLPGGHPPVGPGTV